MLTIQNFEKIKDDYYYTNWGEQEWIIFGVQEYPSYYTFATAPKEGPTYSLKRAVVFQLSRKRDKVVGYILENSKDSRKVGIPKEQLTMHNFKNHLIAQTELIC